MSNSHLRNSNPDYGKGIYRRRVRLENHPQQVVAELEDLSHGFRLSLSHDGHCVTDISAQPIRYPFDTCPGAVAQLKPLLGCALDTDSGGFRRILDPGQNCTHLYDLTLLALAHAGRDSKSRVYDITVPDERDDGAMIELRCDSILLHQWRVRQHRIVEPSELAGKSMQQGFYAWASGLFSADQLEAAVVLQRGYFVAQLRRTDFMHAGGRPATEDNMPNGACYTYNSGVVEKAIHTDGMARDHTASAEQLLQFV